MFYGVHIVNIFGIEKLFCVNEETQEEYELEFEQGEHTFLWPNGTETNNMVRFRKTRSYVNAYPGKGYEVDNSTPYIEVNLNGGKLNLPLNLVPCKVWIDD